MTLAEIVRLRETEIRAAMRDAGHNQVRAAAILGVSLRTVRRWLALLDDVPRLSPGGYGGGGTVPR